MPEKLTLRCLDSLGHSGTFRTKQGFGDWHNRSILYAKGHFGPSGLELEIIIVIPVVVFNAAGDLSRFCRVVSILNLFSCNVFYLMPLESII
jgi:hypothetical protein